MACKMCLPVCVRCVPVYVLIMQNTLKEGILAMHQKFLDRTSFLFYFIFSKNLPSAAKHFVTLSNHLFCSSAKADFNSPVNAHYAPLSLSSRASFSCFFTSRKKSHGEHQLLLLLCAHWHCQDESHLWAALASTPLRDRQ